MSDSIKYEVPQSIEANITPKYTISSNYDSLIKDIETLKQTQQCYNEDLIKLAETVDFMSYTYEEKYAELFTMGYNLTNTQNDLMELVDRIISNIESESSSTRKEFNSLWRVLKIETLVIGILLGGWIIHVL